MIFDIERFVCANKSDWEELEYLLNVIHQRGFKTFGFEKTNRFYYLYHKTSSDLNRIQTFSSQTELIDYLEGLVTRAYAEMYSIRRETWGVRLKNFYLVAFRQVFMKYKRLFYLAFIVMFAGALFGGISILLDPQSKDILIEYGPLKVSPYKRVLKEEQGVNKALDNQKITFSSYLITNNVRVALFTLVLGMTFGLGTLWILFYNGVLLGAIVADYFRYGVGTFAAGWLFPHGAFEIWAILIAGQAGFLIAMTLLKSGRYSRMTQLAMAGKDILTLFFGLSTLLLWAGIVEAFFSQYHEPIIPYSFKIAFGIIELLFLFYYLLWRPSRRVVNGQLQVRET